ncbi:hypothetical protein FOA52_002736 [Chlamydomonas sp. UWO 241]|nr:hypothetical protein FOA52_002736 [Chlamydomonas sp. UWO 241]
MRGCFSCARRSVPAGRTPDDADVQFCADLTAYFSKARDSGKADVIVTLAQHLKKPRGAKPGQIMVIKELRNVVARPSRSEAAKAAVEAGGRGV